MEIFSTDIVSANKKGRIIYWSLVAATSLVIIILIGYGLIPFLLQMIWMAVVIFSFARYFLQTKKQILKKSTGVLSISTDYIEVNYEKFPMSELKAILISVSGWQSYKATGDRSMPVSDFNTGDNNIISFVYNERKVECEFLLRSKEDWQLLREHVINWYRRGIKVIENNTAGKTYGLEALNYSQVQEFKKLIATNTNAK